MSEQISWHRLRLLLRNETISGYRTWLIGSSVVAGGMLLSALFAVDGDVTEPFYRLWFAGALCVGGTIASSLAFSAMHNKSANISFLLLPASALEKTLAPLLVTTLVLIGYLLVFTTVASLVIGGILSLSSARANTWFNPVDATAWHIVTVYLLVQSWFFLGAAWFRSVHYFKTLLAVVIGTFGLTLLTLLMSWITGLATFSASGFRVEADLGEGLPPSFGSGVTVLVAIAWYAVPLFCWYVAWLRVKETQASHGV